MTLGLFPLFQARSDPVSGAARTFLGETVVERGPHHRVFETTWRVTDAQGAEALRHGRYTELRNGLHYLVNDEWVETQELIEAYPGGAAAMRGPHKVIFPATLGPRSANLVELLTPDGKHLRFRMVGLTWEDRQSGERFWLARPRDSVGVILPPNQVLYEDAFEEVLADIRYTYTSGALEQDVILRAPILPPEGLDPESGLVQVVTEFLNPPTAEVLTPGQGESEGESGTENANIEGMAGLEDSWINFGAMQITLGRAFALGESGAEVGTVDSAVVAKRWEAGTGVAELVESVEYQRMRPALERLGPREGRVGPQPAPGGPEEPVPAGGDPRRLMMTLAADSSRTPKRGYVIDFQAVHSTSTWVFQTDQTYKISGSVSISYSTSFQPGAFLKFTSTGSLSVSGTADFPAATVPRCTFTHVDDNTVGEPIGLGEPNPNPAVRYPRALNWYYATGTIRRLEVRYSTFYGLPGQIQTDCASGMGSPVITAQPISRSASVGGSATFSVAATGFGLTYQWYFNNVSIPGATSATYVRTAIQHEHAGAYHVVVANDVGQVKSATVTLTVTGPPQIITPPASQTMWVTGGTELEVPKGGMSVTATSQYPPQWVPEKVKDNVLEDPGWHNDGAYTRELEWVEANLGANYTVSKGSYYPRQMNLQGDPYTDGSWNGVYREYAIYVTHDQANWGGSVASGSWSWPTREWRDVPLVAAKGGRHVYFVRLRAYGWWGQTDYGMASANEIRVYRKTGGSGGSVSFAVGALGKNPAQGQPPFTYAWLKNGSYIPGATTFEYTIPAVSWDDAGQYQVDVSNGQGTTRSAPATLTLIPAGQNRTYTSDTDFQNGVLVNLNYTSVPNQLQLSSTPTPFPYLNVACSTRGTIVRIDVNTGTILGEFRTAPVRVVDQTEVAPNPSRTTVDRFGNVWVANRDDNLDANGDDVPPYGSVTRIGLLVGGTRGDRIGEPPNHTFVPNPTGRYVRPPFIYNTCVDRDGDRLILTSRGLGDILLWNNPGGIDSMGGVSSAEDEAVVNYVRVQALGARTVAVDKNNDVWVGGWLNAVHEKLNGVTGQPVAGTRFPASGDGDAGGYGGFIDGYGVLWSSSGVLGGRSWRLLRFDTTTRSSTILYNVGNYGLGIDPRTQHIWYTWSQHDPGLVTRYSQGGAWLANYFHGFPYSQGVAIDNAANVWVAHHQQWGTTVGHVRADAAWVGNVHLSISPNVVPGPTGIAVDSNGKAWVGNYYANNVMRIDPNAGPYSTSGNRIGAVDRIVYLGSEADHPSGKSAEPYNYSDMTGFVTLGSTFNSGSWVFVHDGGAPGKVWHTVSWTSEIPAGTAIKVEVRAANQVTDLPGTSSIPRPFLAVNSGVSFTGVAGRYLEVRVTLSRDPLVTACPMLYDLTVHWPN
ncbi:MAG: hypothetical protein HS113_07715 [Verrucomicrobiales bacterium]|nr:hypothetical protein [Verrucomicrobiales bacterium]